MQAVLGLLLIALACASSKPLATTEASVYWDPVQGKFSIATAGIDPAAVAYGFCDNMRLVNGWNTLQITTNPSFTDEIQMYGAGYMEGYLEADGIWSAYNNFLFRMLKNKPPPQALVDWSNEQIAWTRHMVMLNHVNDPYWNQVLLTMSQFDGLIKGYGDATASTPERTLGMIELFLWSASGDLYDLLPAVVPSEQVDWENLNRERFAEERMWRTSCSALIKGIFNGDGALADVAVGHNTWTDFGSMVRTYKVFNFQLASATGAKKVSFSSKPGLLYSKDDFYALDTNMVVLETTNGVMDNRLYSLISTQTLLTWQRIPIANRIARSGDEWTRVVAKYNSGTYCNQWMVVDYNKLLAPGKVAPGLLWISEQIPGMSQRADVTNVFMKRGGMWPSFNVPYFPDIYNVSGFPKYFAKFGNEYSYDKCPRAQIFARDGPKVKQFVDMRYIMQYNDFQNDPLSNGNPGNAIASRYDLRTGGSAFGAIDAKITSKADVAAMRVYAISGPTQQQPVFTWDDIRWQSIPHNGQPNTFNFVWQTMSFV